MRYTAALVTADVIAGLLAVAACYIARSHVNLHNVYLLGWRIHYGALAAISIPAWLGILYVSHAYDISYPAEGLREYRVAVSASFRIVATIAIGAFALNVHLTRAIVLVYFPTLAVAAVVCRWIVRRFLAGARKRGRAMNALLLVGDAASVERFAKHLGRRPVHGYRVVGACVPTSMDESESSFPVLGTPDEIVSRARQAGVDCVAVVGDGGFADISLQQVAWQFERSGINLLVAPDVVDLAGPRIRVTPVTGVPLLHIEEPRISSVGRSMKASVERIVAFPLLLLATPVLFLAAVAILIDTGRPVFYRQRRVGYAGRAFTMLKFRTMVVDADQHLDELREFNEHDGAYFKIKQDPRVTRVGRWLRRYSIDELPQLINVIRGDMLLIGPRPCLEDEMSEFSEAAHRRFLAKPGITGLWQISGRSDIPWDEAVRLDLYYVENWSPWMDLQIFWQTIRVVATGHGGY